jgi:cysteine desulfurase family protein
MTDQRLYFDNSATSHPKPPDVADAVMDYLRNVHASAGRGAYREALNSEQILEQCRAAVHRVFSCGPGDHVIFTLNGTDALNLAIKSVVRPGDHVVTTPMDHNSVLRPLSALQQQHGVRWSVVDVDDETRLRPDDVAAALRPETRLVAINHASNVTGALQPIAPIARLCQERGVLLLVDAAQSAGHVPIDLGALPIDLLACPGHKGLLGPLGTGILLIKAGVEHQMQTVREGGTGSRSESATQPEQLPDRFEAGSHNAVGLAGLLAAIRWILDQNITALRRHELAICSRFTRALPEIGGLKWFGPRDESQRVGVFSIRMDELEPAELSALLESRYNILSRSGLHCAPLAHRRIQTLEAGGTTRLSTGPFTTEDEVDAVLAALAEIAATRRTRPAQAGRASATAR